MTVPISKRFSGDFLRQIDQSNQEKKTSSPTALILFSKFYDQIHYSSPVLFFLENISKIYQLSLQTIEESSQIKKSIDKEKNLHQKPIPLLVFVGHGDNSSIDLSGTGCVFSSKDVTKELFHGLTSNATVFLLCCRTGTKQRGGLAQTMSEAIPNATLFASPENLDLTAVGFRFCDQHQTPEMFSKYQEVLKFQKGKILDSCRSNESMTSTYFSNQSIYVSKQLSSNRKDSLSRLALAYMNLHGNNLVMAKFLFEQLAVKGSLTAQRNLAEIYRREKNLQQERFWCEKAAKKECGEDLNRLGELLLREKNPIEAWHYFIKASEKRNPQQALNNLRKMQNKPICPRRNPFKRSLFNTLKQKTPKRKLDETFS
jgi:hypothetical protein